MQQLELLTNDLILRTVTAEDIEEVVRMWMYPNVTTIEEAYKALENMENNRINNQPKAIRHLCLGVFRKQAPKQIIGWCGLDGKAEQGKTVLFYMIDENYRNQGYATQCAKELLRYAFEDMDYDTIYGGCAKDNIESYRVMQKSGMVQTSLYENGDYIFSMDKNLFQFALKCKE